MGVEAILRQIYEGKESTSDPHRNIPQYLGLSKNPKVELEELALLLDRFVEFSVPKEQYMRLYSPTVSQTEKLHILTRAAMRVPFDYIGNAVKTAKIMQQEGDSFITLEDTLNGADFHYLRTPREVLDEFFKFGTGGDCFSTSFFVQILLATHGIPSRMALSFDDHRDSDKPKKKHHCVVIANADGNDYYIDTSLNIEVPILLPTRGEHLDSKNQSSIFRLLIKRYGDLYEVSYVPRPSISQPVKYLKQKAKTLYFGPTKLWNVESGGNPLSEVLPSMLYTLHPFVPSSQGNVLNRNQQVRISALVDENGVLTRKRVFYHEAKGTYLLRTIRNQIESSEEKIDARHDKATGQLIGKEQLADRVCQIFGIDRAFFYKSLDSLDYINARSRQR
jgi:hypothetical protein